MNRPLTAVAVGAVAYLAAEMLRPKERWWIAFGSGGMVLAPLPGLAVLAGWTGARGARWRLARRSAHKQAEKDVGLMARGVLISVTAGMPLPAALELVASQVHPLLEAEIRRLAQASSEVRPRPSVGRV